MAPLPKARGYPPDDSPASLYERLKRAITTGELEPGQPLVEATLAEWYGVSRTPVREALTRLDQDGLVSRSERGLVVRERSPEEILDIYEIRIVLESMAARVAAARRSALDVINLRNQLANLESLEPDDEHAVTDANSALHRAIWLAGHNGPLVEILDRLNHHISARYPKTTLSHPGRWAEANKEHDAIVDAIERQDMTLASELAAAHFSAARDVRLRIWTDDAGGSAAQRDDVG